MWSFSSIIISLDQGSGASQPCVSLNWGQTPEEEGQSLGFMWIIGLWRGLRTGKDCSNFSYLFGILKRGLCGI